jgi:hypothetical protein
LFQVHPSTRPVGSISKNFSSTSPSHYLFGLGQAG